MEIRRFTPDDAHETAALIAHTLRTVNSQDYPSDYIEQNVSSHGPDTLLARAQWSHMYLVWDGGRIVGCGAIAPFWGSETESVLLTIFVHPDAQGKGIGRRIIQTLEADECALRAKRIEIPGSITACHFYKRMGYQCKNSTEPDAEGLIRMEKFR